MPAPRDQNRRRRRRKPAKRECEHRGGRRIEPLDVVDRHQDRPARVLPEQPEVRYPEVHLVFADSRRFAEEWAYRFLSTALADMSDPTANG